MILLVDFFEPFAVNMGVYLRRRNIFMSEKDLNGTQIGATLQKMRREGMTDRVRRYMASSFHLRAVFPYNLPYRLACERPVSFVGKEVRTFRLFCLKVQFYGIPRICAERHDPLL